MTDVDATELMSPAAGPEPMLLSYAIGMTPDPIQTSSPTAASSAVISISVKPAGTAPVYCDTITIYLLIGTDEGALSATSPTASVNTPKWSLSSSQIETAAELGLPDDTGDQYATFTFTCVSPTDYLINYPLTFTLKATPNMVPGIFILNVEENSGTSSSNLTPKDAGFPLAKVPFVFYLDSFTAAPEGSPTIPCTEFTNGVPAKIHFAWEGNGTTYALFEGKSGTAIPIPAGQTSYTLPTGPSVDTTYILQATLTGPGDEDDPAASDSQYLYQALTLTVSNPDLTPNSVAVASTLGVAGMTTLSQAVVSAAPAEQYPAAFDVQNGWTRIGCFNTQTTPQSSESGGMVVGWNRSNGKAETNLYNVFPNSQVSFLFSQIVAGGSSDLLSIAPSGDVWMSGSLSVIGNAQIGGNVSAANVNSPGSIGAGTGFYCSAPSGLNAMRLSAPGAQTGPNLATYVAGFTNTGTGSAVHALGQSSWQAIYAGNSVSDTSHTTGVFAAVATSSDWGLCTTGQVGSTGGSMMFAHVPTRHGMRVVTAAMTLEEELHASGEGVLKQGRATVAFPHELADAIHHSKGHAYRVQLTPTDQCQGLAVVAKTPEGFTVEELGKGTSDAGFDWFLVARRPQKLGSGKVRAMPASMPATLGMAAD